MTIAAKDLHMSIKRGESASEVALKYGISVEELFSYIRSKMHAGSKNLIRALEKNEKSCARAQKVRKSEMVAENANKKNITETIKLEDNQQDSNATEEKDEIVEVNRQEKISQLKADESELSKELCALELEHENMVSRRRTILQEAKKSSEQLLEIQQVLLETQKRVEESMQEYEKLADDMSSNNTERQVYEELLEEIRKELENLNRVEILVKNDCAIVCSNPEVFDVLTTEAEEAELKIIMSIPEAEDYTLKQLKAIAKIRVIKQCYEVNVRCEIPFPADFFGGEMS